MKRLIPLALLLTLGGCASFNEMLPDEDSSHYEPLQLDYSVPPTSGGGLFRSGYSGSLIGDKRAVRVGDILTVVLDESTQSSKSAGTSFGKSSGVSVGIPTVLGKTYDRLESSAEAERDFNGSARSSQQNTLRGSIAVTVHQVLPNGTLLIKGEKALRLNQGDEYIRLVGLVRMDDINRANQVSSQNVANARISYAGRGVLSDSNSAGWLTRFFTSPLFPL
ncbi:flagellar L-ring protein precursor FlgH [Pseudomonas sp. NFACC19-2]|uniref:Flagellar L-ring protein n=1 Tax=Ectopseudomonas toyotomiensis TaxID=554344 RepID=A0A1I5T9E4_9GAMM|nr:MULTISPECIES: flagellar basal body L-ring protein FlgH [Pseudomonas]AQZ35588.1 flagellar basal body L-ring protein [Pseudomonas sp. LPH1]MBG0839954.1 flagellar basal body L-ring protein FlgH [Pseudomonas toyotomiensis]MDH0704835.1 flagellar basal body L-ring protein FlgH [Pseudomonas toyotomiensis]PIA74011.1 flagellar basal body L-ring protein [Pseudomonas toyotomiensis]QSL94903.1 flagellar basal body L-ring protein FlgH [Pseudomonas toyotomiensis]